MDANTGLATTTLPLPGGRRSALLLADVRSRPPTDAARRLAGEADETIAEVVERLHAPLALGILEHFPDERRARIRRLSDSDRQQQWEINERYEPESIGRLMEQPAGVFGPDTRVGEAVEALREAVKRTFITYLYIVDPERRLTGLVAMRELVLASPDQSLRELMITEPFTLTPEMPVGDAMRRAVALQLPVYPVCDEARRLVGLVRGAALFEQNIVRLVVQAGSMVGVEKEERLTTSWLRSLRMRHPWLQLNLLTACVAGAVVGLFQETIDRAVVLAAFLPILAGQSGNTGCQALAVTLRGMTLGELGELRTARVVTKEALLGLANGAVVGLIAAALMYLYAWQNGGEASLRLSLVVLLAMTGSCVASGISGSLVPIALRRLGTDPATASSIFLTTATDVVSMGLLLGLATLVVR